MQPLVMFAQTTNDWTIGLPPDTPIMLLLGGGILGTVLYIVRRYVDHRLNQQRVEMQARIDKQKSDSENEASESQSMLALAQSIEKLATAVTESTTTAATDRMSAAEERKALMGALGTSQDDVKRIRADLEDIGKLANKLSDTINAKLDTLISKSETDGGPVSERRMTELMGEVRDEITRTKDELNRLNDVVSKLPAQLAPEVPASAIPQNATS